MKTPLALLLFTAVAHAKPTLQTTDATLANGVHVIVAPDATVNSIGVFVRHDDCAAALAQPANIDDELDRIDGFATESFETTHFDAYTQVPAGGLELALWFEAKRMKTPALAPAAAAPDDEYSMVDAAIETALRPHVAVEPDEAQRCVAPEHTTIAIVGRIDVEAAIAIARKYFAGFAPSKRPTRVWRSTFSTVTTVTLHGSSRRDVVAWSIPRELEATALVAEVVVASYGLDLEVRDEQVRLVHGDVARLGRLMGVVAEIHKRRVDTELLEKLETLRYRASLLASGTNIDKLRASIARVSDKDLEGFAALLAKTPAFTIELRQ